MPSRPATPRPLPDFSISRNFSRVHLRSPSECEKKAKLRAKLRNLRFVPRLPFVVRRILRQVDARYLRGRRRIAAERKRNRVKLRSQETAYQQIRLSDSFLLEIFLRRASSHERRLTSFPRANETVAQDGWEASSRQPDVHARNFPIDRDLIAPKEELD